MSDLVGNPEDRFSHVAAHILKHSYSRLVMSLEQPQGYAKRIFTGTSEHEPRDQTKFKQSSEFSRILFFHSTAALYEPFQLVNRAHKRQ